MLKAVLFDMDGVLVDSEPEYNKIEAELALSVGVKLTRNDIRENLGKSHLDGWISLKKKYGFSEDPGELTKKEARMMRVFYEKKLVPIPPSVKLLKRCSESGLKVAVATSSPEEFAALAVTGLGLEYYVDAIAGGDKVKNSKPAPDIFLLAADLLCVSPEECVVIEDSANGVAAAKAAGMKAVGLKTHEVSQDFSKADMAIVSLSEIDVETLRKLF